AVKGISDIINIPGRVNVDFADVRTIMSEMGMALMGIGTATGQNRAIEAARAAINSPLLEDVDIEGATGILINITGSSEMTLHEISEASTLIQEAVHEDANIIFGSVVDETMGENLRVTVIATGFDHARVSLPESHSKLYPSASVGYGHQPVQAMPTMGAAMPNHGNTPYGSRGPVGNSGYGHGQTDGRNVQMQNTVHNSRPDMGMNRGSSYNVQNQNPNTAPVAAGLSLRAPYEVGQPVNTGRRSDNLTHEAPTSQPARFAAAASSVNSNNTGATAHGTSFNAGRGVTNSPGLGLNTGFQNESADTTGFRHNNAALKSEFEELTQWTLEMSRQTNSDKHNSAGGENTSEAQLQEESIAGLNLAHLIDETENEKALRLARELAEISPDESDFETPAFLRKKDETHNRVQ
ncbi:MAG: hypothetical protein RIR26_2702, partial [Pseudomonadota bacterium]